MALTILYTVTRSQDFKSIDVKDANTAWGQGGEIGTGDVTNIALSLFGTDKDTPLKIVTFTSGERATFLSGGTVTLLFSDARLWSTVYAPDNLYVAQLDVSGGTTVSTQVAFTSWFYLKKIINDHITSVVIPLETYYEANKAITGDLAAYTTLEYFDSVISPIRESKWRKTYDYLQWNYNI